MGPLVQSVVARRVLLLTGTISLCSKEVTLLFVTQAVSPTVKKRKIGKYTFMLLRKTKNKKYTLTKLIHLNDRNKSVKRQERLLFTGIKITAMRSK